MIVLTFPQQLWAFFKETKTLSTSISVKNEKQKPTEFNNMFTGLYWPEVYFVALILLDTRTVFQYKPYR